MNEVLHIYAQTGPHDRAFICGTKEELIRLRDNLDLILQEDKNSIIYDTFTYDGEGYSVQILKIEEDEFKNLIIPYTDEIFAEKSTKDRIHPWFYTLSLTDNGK